jgi:hypothetical protein
MELVYGRSGTESPMNGNCQDNHNDDRETKGKIQKRQHESPHGNDTSSSRLRDSTPTDVQNIDEHEDDRGEEVENEDDHDMQSNSNPDGSSVGKRKHKNKHKSAPICWLCEYQGNRTTDEVIRFIMDGIPHMALDSLITQSKYLLDRVDVGSDCSVSQIRRHVTSHMLHPRIKLALQLQDMVKMQQEVSKCCVVDDVEAGGKTINPQAMRVYLTLCTQVTGVYKMGEEKLTFNQVSEK